MKYLKCTINNKQNPDTIQYQKIAARYPTYPPRKKGRDELKMMIKKEGKGKIHMVIEGTNIPDPYYGGDKGFKNVYQMLDEAVLDWLNRLAG